MTAIDYSRLETDELIRRFVAAAAQVGGAYTFPMKMDPASTEAKDKKAEIKAIADELRERKPIAELRKLFNHESPDVRSWAAGQFLSTDPQWASAAYSGLSEGLSTIEALELRRRALTPPPRSPRLKEMSVDQLLARFEDAAMRKYATRFLSDPEGGPDTKQSNRIAHEIIDIVHEIEQRDALTRLVPMLDHANITVRHEAATHCLPVAPKEAVAVLESILRERDPNESFMASRTLDRWQRGVYGTSAP